MFQDCYKNIAFFHLKREKEKPKTKKIMGWNEN
jgi:hypothetical protein